MKPYKEQTYYELLDIDPSASMDEIRAAWERAVRVYDSENVALYPVGDPAQVEELKALLLEAMEILTDEDLRVEYDNSLGLTTPWPERVKARAAARPAPAAEAPGAPGGPAVEAAVHALRTPPEPAEIDARAAEARKQGDTHVVEDARAHEHLPPPRTAAQTARPVPRPELYVVQTPVTSSRAAAWHAVADAAAATVDARADEAREAADAEAEAQTRSHRPEPSPQAEPPSGRGAGPVRTPGGATAGDDEDPAEQPKQLEMHEVLSRAEAVHSTAPRYSVSYIPQTPKPPPEPWVGRIDARRDSGTFARPPIGPSATPQPSTPPAPPAPTSGAGQAAPASAGGAPERPASTPRPLEQAPVIAQESAIAEAESALAQVSAQVSARPRSPSGSHEARPRPFEIPPDAEINGEILRQARKSRGLTLQHLADRTRISTRHLENVEADRYDQLPAAVYLRGILMSVARELALDPLRIARGYLALVERELSKRR